MKIPTKPYRAVPSRTITHLTVPRQSLPDRTLQAICEKLNLTWPNLAIPNLTAPYGSPNRIRTYDLPIRSRMLYSAELSGNGYSLPNLTLPDPAKPYHDVPGQAVPDLTLNPKPSQTLPVLT